MDQAVIKQEEQARANRERMPRFSAWLSTLRARFGEGDRVLFAKDGDVERGVRIEDRLVDGRWPC